MANYQKKQYMRLIKPNDPLREIKKIGMLILNNSEDEKRNFVFYLWD